jgi:tripartite-type tricarboxylate transporter receptor subunit TctC
LDDEFKGEDSLISVISNNKRIEKEVKAYIMTCPEPHISWQTAMNLLTGHGSYVMLMRIIDHDRKKGGIAMGKVYRFFYIIILTIPFIASIATAQEKYPSRPITLINPFTAGAGVDMALRGLAKEMNTLLGVPVLVESRPGAGGTIAGEYVARSKPDGYTIGSFQSPQAIPELYSAFLKAPYTSADLRPVVRYFVLPFALVSRAGAPWKNLNEFVKYVKENPNKVRWGQANPSGSPHTLLSESFFKKNNLKLIVVPYKAAANAIVGLLGGHIDVCFGISVTAIQGHVQAGKLEILALHNPKKLSMMPEIPTFKDLGLDPGVPDFYTTLYVAKGTPDNVVKQIHDTVKTAMETPALQEFARKNVINLHYGSEKDIIEEMKNDREIMAPLVEAAAKEQK